MLLSHIFFYTSPSSNSLFFIEQKPIWYKCHHHYIEYNVTMQIFIYLFIYVYVSQLHQPLFFFLLFLSQLNSAAFGVFFSPSCH